MTADVQSADRQTGRQRPTLHDCMAALYIVWRGKNVPASIMTNEHRNSGILS